MPRSAMRGSSVVKFLLVLSNIYNYTYSTVLPQKYNKLYSFINEKYVISGPFNKCSKMDCRKT